VIRAALVVLAAGSGTRMGLAVNKVLTPLGDRPLLCWSFDAAAHLPEVTRVLLVTAERDRPAVQEVLSRELPAVEVRIVTGGDTRHASERNALSSLAEEIQRGELDIVVVHDAARPLAPTALFTDVMATAHAAGGAVPSRPLTALICADTSATAPVREAVTVQTPQAFRAGPLLSAYEQGDRVSFIGTDTASCFERFSELPVRCVPASADNIKVTFPEDLVLAEDLLGRMQGEARQR
jgi:2-C-methyl-D-erythritol 4-phosphate cytidylyltransferase